jgi:hypothetical protein
MATPDTQQQLRAFVKRRHPLYHSMRAHWDFLVETYEGGRCWFDDNVFRYFKEGTQEFEARVKRAYRFNHSREVVDLVDKYLFKVSVTRNEEDAPESVKAFWKNATLKNLPIKDFIKRVSNRASVGGRPYVVVDSNKSASVKTVAEERASGARIYAYIVQPADVLDLSHDEQGELSWILIRERERDDADALNGTGAVTPRFRLWTRNGSQLFRAVDKKTRAPIDPDDKRVDQKDWEVEVAAEVVHGLGEVPVFRPTT